MTNHIIESELIGESSLDATGNVLQLLPDHKAVQRFLAKLDPAGEFTFQSFDDNKTRAKEYKAKHGHPDWELTRILHGSIEERGAELVWLNTLGAGIYVCVNETDGDGRETENIVRVRALFIDLDEPGPLPTFHLKPHIIVQSSPGKYQAHWLVKDCRLDQFVPMQERLAAHYGSDTAVADLPHVMRIPGFFHRKLVSPFPSDLVEIGDHAAYALEEIATGLPLLAPAPAGTAGVEASTQGDSSPKAEKRDPDDPFPGLNTHALENLDAWVPKLYPAARKSNQGWRVSSADLDRELEEDLSFTPHGIKDFGVHDMGDARGGKRTAIAAVMEGLPGDEATARRWLCEALGIPADEAPKFSEDAIASELAGRYANSLRYVAKWGQWFIWDGTCWREDEKRRVFTLARGICREVALTINKPSERKKTASSSTRAAVLNLASDDPRIAATVDQWDTDPWLLNTPDGAVDLRTGKLREHRPEDYMTKCTATSPGGGCPKWKKFMDEITAGDAALAGYLQRVGGYCLTGVTREQQLFFFYGTGNNGKGVWVQTISNILADYHRSSPIETFTVSQHERHPTELAGLRGARLVTASETEEGRRWAEARIKELTGGDKISARFMRQDFFDFYPQFKLLLSGNHMPRLRTVNKAITRRFNRIPFAITIAPEKVDVHLVEKLMQEGAGILAWFIEGCLAWQRGGLQPPEAVTVATESYLASQDVIGDWLEDCCDVGRGYWAPSTPLFDSWKEWAEPRGEWIGTTNQFAQKLEDRGFTPQKNRAQTARGFIGLRLKGGRCWVNDKKAYVDQVWDAENQHWIDPT
jgi:putative DNA primase/helicase